MTAAAAEHIVNSVINVSGELNAPIFPAGRQRIDCLQQEGSDAVPNDVIAEKGQKTGGGAVTVSGTVRCLGKNPGGKGGSVQVLADHVDIASSTTNRCVRRQGRRLCESRRRFPWRGRNAHGAYHYDQSGSTIDASAISGGKIGGKVAVWRTTAIPVYSAIFPPAGASGARVLVTLLHEMQKRDAKRASPPCASAAAWELRCASRATRAFERSGYRFA